MSQEIIFPAKADQALAKTLRRFSPRSIFLVTGKTSYRQSSAEALFSGVLAPYTLFRFVTAGANPELEDIKRGIVAFRQTKADLILAVGGGSVMDTAKLIGLIAAQDHSPAEIVADPKLICKKGDPLVVVPTTAGSGTEATQFAVVYVEKTKYSVAHPYALPDVAILDPALTASLSPRQTAISGMDAFCQAVESYWCVNATAESQDYAAGAIALVRKHLVSAVQHSDALARAGMSHAALLAGQAINITRTTAPHAVSYTMTAYHAVPHGLAVSLTLGEFLVFNAGVTESDVCDGRGVEYVRGMIVKLCALLGVASPQEARLDIHLLMEQVGLETRLSQVGIRPEYFDRIVENANTERLVNHPRKVTAPIVRQILEAIA